MFNLIPFSGRLLQEDQDPILLDDGVSYLLWTNSETYLYSPFKAQMDYTERLEWATDIIPSKTKEQRLCLRRNPRTYLNLRIYLNEKDYRDFRSMLRSIDKTSIILPDWRDFVMVSSIGASDLEIPLNMGMGFYNKGDFVVIQFGNDYYLKEIASITLSSIFIETPIGVPVTNVKLMTSKIATIKDGVNFNRGALNNNFCNLVFETQRNYDYSASLDYQTYKGYYVLNDCQPILSGLDERVVHLYDVYDNITSLPEYEQINYYVDKYMTCNLIAKTLNQRLKIIRFLHNMKGRFGSFWLPSFHNDFIINLNITAIASTIKVSSIGYGYYYRDGEKQSFVIEMKNGTRYYNTIISSTKNRNEEIFTLENSFGSIINIASIRRVMFINRVRFDADAIELKHLTSNITTVSVPVREVQL